MKILILGSEGQLGYEFKNYLEKIENVYSFSHKEVDILDIKKLDNILKEIRPDIVINCVAYTKVDKCEDETDLAFLINSIGAKNISYLSYKYNSKIIYFSTDYIFDGEKKSPYNEFDKPNPLSVYGRSKLFGEKYTKEFNPNHLIIRISWLYGIKGDNFVKTIIKLSKINNILRIVNDQMGSPTYTLDVVKQTYELIKRDYIGLIHSANIGETSWFNFANLINKKLKLNIKIIPIKTEEYNAKAKRPKYSVLENYILKIENLNIMRNWEVAFNEFIENYKGVLLNG